MSYTSECKTLRADNQFRFVCPIFGAEVKIADCLTLNEHWMKGKPIGVRKGCQACMSAGKCPVIALIADMRHHDTDPYYSAEPKVGKLRTEHLAKIAPVIVPDHLMRKFDDMQESQKAAILATNGVSGMKNLKGRSGEDIPVQLYEEAPKRKRAKPAAEEAPSAVIDAATSGDMSAAINKAAEKAA